jgi:hypothetical protein
MLSSTANGQLQSQQDSTRQNKGKTTNEKKNKKN